MKRIILITLSIVAAGTFVVLQIHDDTQTQEHSLTVPEVDVCSTCDTDDGCSEDCGECILESDDCAGCDSGCDNHVSEEKEEAEEIIRHCGGCR